MNRRSVLAALPLSALLLFAPGCSSDSATTEYVVDCESAASGQPYAADESLTTLIEAEAAGRFQKDAAKAPALVSPATDATVDAASPPKIQVKFRSAQARLDVPSGGSRSCQRGPARHAFALSDLLVGRAEAHCAAFSGENVWLRLRVPGQTTALYEALLSVESFTPDATRWKAALDGQRGKSIEVVLVRGVFTQGRLDEAWQAPAAATWKVAP